MLNQVILIGRLGHSPDIKHLPNGDTTARLSLATTEKWNKDGTTHERTEWHTVIFYRRLAEIAAQYLQKGSLICVQGKIQSRKYTGKDGNERTAYEIIGSELKMLDSKKAAPESAAPESAAPETPPALDAALNTITAAFIQTHNADDEDIPY